MKKPIVKPSKEKLPTTITTSEWLQAVEASRVQRCDEIPPGWKTIKQIAVEINRSRYRTSEICLEWLRDGLAERKVFTVTTPSGGLYPTPHFRLIKKPSAK